MLALLLLPILVSGFTTCHIHPDFRYRLHRYEGQYLYLKSAQIGFRNLLIGGVIIYLSSHFLPVEVNLLVTIVSLDIQTWLTQFNHQLFGEKLTLEYRLNQVVLISLFLVCWPVITTYFAKMKYRIRYRGTPAYTVINSEILSDSPLDSFLFRMSIEKGKKLVMLSMKDRKVYVGKVNSLGEPNESNAADQEVSIIPIMSGYRDKDTMEVKFTTLYERVADDANNYTIVRQDEIVSASEFDFDTYEKLNLQKQDWTPVP